MISPEPSVDGGCRHHIAAKLGDDPNRTSFPPTSGWLSRKNEDLNNSLRFTRKHKEALS